MLIRPADPAADATACAAIYAPSVLDGVASLEERAPSPEEMAARIRTTSAAYPWLIAELEGKPVGYAYATEHRGRSAYRWSADTTVYVSPRHHRRGVGRALYDALFELLTAQGLYNACAGITLPNDASVRLHEAMGFELIGVYRAIGYKHGRWLSVSWWQAQLRAPRDHAAPANPGPPARLDAQ
ncbi:MAG: arsinothricin resistance N-acetyltransferase ArsN1 family B [Solirubrobacteraceae bacterium]